MHSLHSFKLPYSGTEVFINSLTVGPTNFLFFYKNDTATHQASIQGIILHFYK